MQKLVGWQAFADYVVTDKIISAVDRSFRAGQFWVYSTFQIITFSKILTFTTRNAMQAADVLKTIDTVNYDGRKSTDRKAPSNY
jgi:hypothetical protein